MREILTFSPAAVIPDGDRILESPNFVVAPDRSGRVGSASRAKILPLLQEALACFAELVRPTGLYCEVEKEEFAKTINREAAVIPLDQIHEEAEKLALFAVTIGESICRKISELFGSNDYVLACLLDEVASQGTELAADLAQQEYARYLKNEGLAPSTVVERYSPGYCGWHVSSQARLFAILGPSTIGIRLNDSFLMQPLKSISGVFLAGQERIHSVNNAYSFCKKCATARCQQRKRRSAV